MPDFFVFLNNQRLDVCLKRKIIILCNSFLYVMQMILFLDFYLHEEAMNWGYKIKVHWQGCSCGRKTGKTALSANLLGILTSEQVLFCWPKSAFLRFQIFFIIDQSSL